jgi:LysR family transcriptional activator of nhaA
MPALAKPTIAVDVLKRSHSVSVIGATEDCRERFFALSAERRLKHPAVIAISQTARSDLFGDVR